MKIIDDGLQHQTVPIAELIPRLVWTMANVCVDGEQGDAHLVSVDDHIHVLIDTGSRAMAEQQLLPLLHQSGISTLDLVFISHAHKDHYGGLDVLIDHGIDINRLYFNLPDRDLCLEEIPWGCDYDDVIGVRDRLVDRGIELRALKPGLRFELGGDTRLEVLYVFDGIDTPVGRTDINDTSAVIKIHHDGHSLLFTGDLNEDIGGYLAETADDLKADILKVPHHGVDPIAPAAFFEKVAPRYGLVSSPASYWLEAAGDRLRTWFERNRIPVYINGTSGHVKVIIDNGRLRIDAAC